LGNYYQAQENRPQGKQQLIGYAKTFVDGIYYYRLQVGEQAANEKMVKVKYLLDIHQFCCIFKAMFITFLI